MSRYVFPALIASDLDPFFAIEILTLFGVLIANYSIISLLGLRPGQTQADAESFSILLLRAAYVPLVLILVLVIYTMARSLEDGRFLTYITFPYSSRRVTSYMFAYTAIYPAVLCAAVLTGDSWAFSLFTWPLVPAELVFYTVCFSVMFAGIGIFLAVLTRSSILASGIPGSLYVFVLPAIISHSISSSLLYAVAGLYFLKSGNPFSTTYIYGGVFEIIMGFVLFMVSVVLVRRRNLRPTRR